MAPRGGLAVDPFCSKMIFLVHKVGCNTSNELIGTINVPTLYTIWWCEKAGQIIRLLEHRVALFDVQANI